MNVVYAIPPGKFPTVMHDPGKWMASMDQSLDRIQIINLNEEFWRMIFDQRLLDFIIKTSKISKRLTLSNKKMQFNSLVGLAGSALQKLETEAAYENAQSYISTITALIDYLIYVNNLQDDYYFDLFSGININHLNWNESKNILEFVKQESLLEKLISEILAKMNSPVDMLLLQVTSMDSFITSILVTLLLRKKNKDMYVCLADHGYENFSLEPFKESLLRSGIFTDIFDSVIEFKDEKDPVIKLLMDDVRNGNRRKGLIKHQDFEYKKVAFDHDYQLTVFKGFSSEPILLTRAVEGGCYWGKCAFCTHNTKHSGIINTANIHFEELLHKISCLVQSGYRNIIFTDEALSPAFLESFSNAIVERNLDFKWSCRIRMERVYGEKLFGLMKKAGCYEVLFGMESISPKVLKRMNKYAGIPDKESMAKILNDAEKSGIAVHINLIAGFPGEEEEELKASVDFLEATLKNMNGATFLINRFTLFPNTVVSKNPEKFNIEPVQTEGDLNLEIPFLYKDGPYAENKEKLDSNIMKCYEELFQKLGWRKFGSSPGVDMSIFLYFISGHGSIFKNRSNNIFTNPLKEQF